MCPSPVATSAQVDVPSYAAYSSSTIIACPEIARLRRPAVNHSGGQVVLSLFFDGASRWGGINRRLITNKTRYVSAVTVLVPELLMY